MKLVAPLVAADFILNSLDVSDAEGPYVTWFSDPAVTEFLVPIDGAMTVDRLRTYIEENNADQTALLAGLFMKRDFGHIGNIRLSGLDRALSRSSVGIVIGARNFWGKGYASAAIRALSDFAHSELGIRYLYAGCHELNQGSVRAFLNAGYVDFASAPQSIRSIDALRNGIAIDHVMMVHCRG